MSERHTIKDVPVQTQIMLFTEHRMDASTHRIKYTWNAGGISATANEEDSLATVLDGIRRTLRSSRHWDVATQIAVEFRTCDYAECLCVTFGVVD